MLYSGMKPTLQLKLSQHLALTPQLQQSIRLLQLSTLELNQELEQILADNPMIERMDDPLEACARINPNGSLDPPSYSEAPSDAPTAPTGPEFGQGDMAPEHDLSRHDTELDWGSEGRGSTERHTDDDAGFPQIAAENTTLRQHLLQQLLGTHGTHRDRTLVSLLIEELDYDGYLPTDLDTLHGALPLELAVTPEELTTALRLVQSFDPPGVGARNLAECLRLQLLAEPPQAAASSAHLDLAHALIATQLEALAVRDFAQIKRMLRCDDTSLRAAIALIQTLNPRPGSAFAGDPARYVIPDIRVRRMRSKWLATLNHEVIPRLSINDAYAQALKSPRGGPSHATLNSQLQEARWLIKNVQQRFETILRVSQAIVDRQSAFFSHGAVAMRPLVLREIADELDLHESTISRVTTQKFMLTPFGTFELKYFFGSHVATDTGGAASSTAIRALIKQLITEENTHHPLSDSRIAELLGEQGIVVARRTVAKYREALLIPPVTQRKTL